jgi:hypothetical protein
MAWTLAFALLTGCDAAENVRVQPLPSLERLTPETRAGLPEIAGMWRFAGWELAPGDTNRVASTLPGFGDLLVETQRLDSIAGFYLAGEGRLPLIGEVRRDSVVSLAGGDRYLAGVVSSDTLWLTLTSLVPSADWPDRARAAFVRSTHTSRFVRVRGQVPALAAADSLREPSVPTVQGRQPALPRTAAPAHGAAPPAEPGGERLPRQGVPAPAPGGRADEDAPPPSEPRPAAPTQAPPAERGGEEPRREQPTPEISAPRRPTPRVLGVPVDSSSTQSPTAARAISRPAEVRASR